MENQNPLQTPRQPQPEDQFPILPPPLQQSPEPPAFDYAVVPPTEYEPATGASFSEPVQPVPLPSEQNVPLVAVPVAAAPPAGVPTYQPHLPPQPEPVPVEQSYEFTPVSPAPKKSRNKFLIGGIIAGVLVLLIGGGVAAYQFVYQNPTNVMTDAVMHAIQSKTILYSGTIASTSDGTKIDVKVTGASATITQNKVDVEATITTNGKTYAVKGSSVVDKSGTLYIKLANVRSLLDTVMSQVGIKTAAFDSLISTIDNKWIMITADDLSSYNGATAKVQTCISTAASKFTNDTTAKKELTDDYKQHPFLKIDNNLASQTIGGIDSMGYSLSVDTSKVKAYLDVANKSQFVKDLKACDSSIKLNSSDVTPSASGDTTTVHAWVSRWGHDFTRLEVAGGSGTNTSSLTVDPVFNKPVTIDTPKNALTIKQIQDEFTKALTAYEQEIYMNSLSPRGTATVPSTPGV
jgi:hypothetical protein